MDPLPVCEKDRVKAEDEAMQAQMAAERRKARIETMLPGQCRYSAGLPNRIVGKSADIRWRAQKVSHRACSTLRHRMARQFPQALALQPDYVRQPLPRHRQNPPPFRRLLAKHIMDEGGTTLFTRVIDMIRTVRETYGRDSTRTERQVIAEYARPDLLILDEVGHQHGSDAERLTLFDVINARYEQCRPTLLITNLEFKRPA